MKEIGKYLTKKVAGIILVVGLIVIGFLLVQKQFLGAFSGSHTAQYAFVIKKFKAESKLVVAGAEVDTTANHTFENDELKEWPDWTQPITKFFVSRELTVEIPIQTEFKLVLKGIDKSDITVQNNTLTFKKPLVVEVDSQQVGTVKLSKASNGLVDKAVDAFTSGQKAQEFLNEKSQEAIYKTSEAVLNNAERQEKVAAHAETALENLLNLNSDEKLEVSIEVEDLDFQIVDQNN